MRPCQCVPLGSCRKLGGATMMMPVGTSPASFMNRAASATWLGCKVTTVRAVQSSPARSTWSWWWMGASSQNHMTDFLKTADAESYTGRQQSTHEL